MYPGSMVIALFKGTATPIEFRHRSTPLFCPQLVSSSEMKASLQAKAFTWPVSGAVRRSCRVGFEA